jgi:hypothetical protein
MSGIVVNFSKSFLTHKTHTSRLLCTFDNFVLKFLKSFITSRKFCKSWIDLRKGENSPPNLCKFLLVQQKYVGKTHSLSSTQGAEEIEGIAMELQ